MKYRMAAGVALVERAGATFLTAKTPLAMVRLNAPLVRLAQRALAGPVAAESAAESKVLEQLAAKGFMERLPEEAPAPSESRPSVSVVIPVLDRADELARCLASIAALDYPREKVEVIVVDDGSVDRSAEVAREHGAQVVSSGGTRRGPAAARNVGAACARHEILAFIDSDCSASTSWLTRLVPYFNDAGVAAVGGMVEGMCDESAVDRYEAVMSSLSLGARERFGGPGDDTFYLPSCNLLVRRELFVRVNGFKDEMHVGEDVDLTWRLRDAGWTIAYTPTGNVLHEHRSSVRSFMSRRFDYGTSEGMLQKLHPRRRKKFVLPPVLGAVLALVNLAPFAGWWLIAAAAALLAADAARYQRRVAGTGLHLGFFTILGGRVRALGGLSYYLSYHLVRYYILALCLVALVVPPVWVLLVSALFTCAAVDHQVRKPTLSFLVFAGIYLLEQLAYGAGVFWGCLRGRGFASYRVTILKKMEVAA